MTATNHVLAGGLIGAFLPLPVAVPLALVSHFVMDAIPHYGLDDHERKHVRTFKAIVFSDAAVALILAAIVIYLQKWNILICGFVAVSPDFVWVYHYFEQGRKIDRLKSTNPLNDWHQNRLQREHPWGIFVELGFTAAMLPFFIDHLK